MNLRELIEIVYKNIDNTHNDIKLMIVSWIIFINSIPEIKIINVSHEFLGELFNMLSCDNKYKICNKGMYGPMLRNV